MNKYFLKSMCNFEAQLCNKEVVCRHLYSNSIYRIMNIGYSILLIKKNQHLLHRLKYSA